jgi:hypothetical protein
MQAMLGLHKRKRPGKFADIDPKNDEPSTGACVLPNSPSSWFLLPRLVILVLSLAVSGAWFLSSKEPSPLSNTYAVCSLSGARVYTVDEVIPNVQCLVVDGSFIIDSGTLGMSK